MIVRTLLVISCFVAATASNAGETTEFCLDGEFNIGARLQGTEPGVDEFVPTRWCVISQDDSSRVLFSGKGKANPDMNGEWTVAFLPPDLVRIVNSDDPPDIEFRGASSLGEAIRVRRLDPRRLVDEHLESPIENIDVMIKDGRLHEVKAHADLPLRGRVPVQWNWTWSNAEAPQLQLTVDSVVFFRAQGSWRALDAREVQELWVATPGVEPVQVPGDRWPSQVNMQIVDVAEGVYLVRGVRTGFQHLVIDTAEGLIIADAPAGWVEFHQLPPTDLVLSLGVSGLSERFVDFLGAELPDRPIRAVVLTHAHDDHAGGARAFVAAGADVYAPAEYAKFLEASLNRRTMPNDRLAVAEGHVTVIPVEGETILDDVANPVRIVSIGAGPHSSAAVGVHAEAAGYFFVSDIHVPHSDAETPRAERATTECWFSRWAVANLPSETIVLNTHSAPQTPVARLKKYLHSPECRDKP